MSTRGQTIQALAERQIADLTRLVTDIDQQALQRPCREKLGDGTVGACIQHTAENYERIAALPTISAQQLTKHPPRHGTQRIPRLLQRFGHKPPDHSSQYAGDTVDPGALVTQLELTRQNLTQFAGLTDAQLNAIPPNGGMRFCDGQRNLEQVLNAMLKHQSHQLEAIRSAIG